MMRHIEVAIVLMAVLAACVGPSPTVSPIVTPTYPPSPLMSSSETGAGELKTGVSKAASEAGDGGATMDFSDVVVNGIPLVILIVGLVQFIAEMGVSGKTLKATSAGIGVVTGLAYQLSLGIPTDFAGWFGAILYGLGLGVVASGLVDQARSLATRIGSR